MFSCSGMLDDFIHPLLDRANGALTLHQIEELVEGQDANTSRDDIYQSVDRWCLGRNRYIKGNNICKGRKAHNKRIQGFLEVKKKAGLARQSSLRGSLRTRP